MTYYPLPSYREVAHDRTDCFDSVWRNPPGSNYHMMPLADRPAVCPDCGARAVVFTSRSRAPRDEYYRDGVHLRTLPAWWVDIRDQVHVNGRGAIVYDSRLERVRPACDVNRLIRCVEDVLLGADALT